MVLACQRAEATIIGAAERAQCAGRLSFRTDNYDSIKLLHADAPPELAAEHSSAPAGVALLSWPGREISRVRGPWLGDYSAFARAVAV
jgi:S-DNA-T family DNA segregation ATPase FtsK/SpoIIIE